MKHSSLRNLVICLLASLCLTVFLTGCGAKTEHLALPFTVDEIDCVELFFQSEEAATPEKKVLKTQNDLQALWDEMDGLPIQKKDDQPEPDEGSAVLSIRFLLQDGSTWQLAYESLGTKAGHLYSTDYDHFTSTDVAGIWDRFDVPVLPVSASEMPFAS